MRFAFSEDQLLFRDTLREFLAKECPPSAVRAVWEGSASPPTLWQGLADMGVIGAMLDPVHGGLGMSELDMVLLLEEAGRAALPAPLVESCFVAAPLLGACFEAGAESRVGELLKRVADGSATVAVALAATSLVLGADDAEMTVIRHDDRLVAVEHNQLRATAQPSVARSRRLFAIDWDESDEIELCRGDAALLLAQTASERGALGAAAQLIGLAGHLLDMTVEYVKTREQFGVPIGSFQAIKHHLADALLALEFARPVVYRAAYSMSLDLDTASRDVSMAKCVSGDAANLVARKALQCHGAIGYTVEYDLHMWIKSLWSQSASWGDAAHHRAKVAESILGPRPYAQADTPTSNN